MSRTKRVISRKQLNKKSYYQFDKYDEFAYFLFSYLFPLLDIPDEKSQELVKWNDESLITESFSQDEEYRIYIASHKKSAFKLEYNRKISESEIRLARRIIDEFGRISKFWWKSGKPHLPYPTEEIAQKIYLMTLQRGICSWLTGDGYKNAQIIRLFDLLERWTVKTYEGKKVTFGILINRKEKSKNVDCDFIRFMEEDYSALLTDCINSVVEIDKMGNLIRYHSITENNCINQVTLSPKMPYRFASVLYHFVNSHIIGVFLLNNGDIILSENGQIRFIKRNLHWINMSYEAFMNATQKLHIDNNVLLVNCSQILLDAIYATTLDVSFAHTGGIIAVVDKIDTLKENGILSNVDNVKYIASDLENEKTNDQKIKDELLKDIPEDKQTRQILADIDKRILKRKIIISLINGKKFYELDRKLRAELIAMDGACIMTNDGEIYSFGAIIQNDSGSSGGGRGAAAKKLSKNGMALKISADGYIEMYIQEIIEYSVK